MRRCDACPITVAANELDTNTKGGGRSVASTRRLDEFGDALLNAFGPRQMLDAVLNVLWCRVIKHLQLVSANLASIC
ncbi:hypothetical protein E1B28_011736 [Marasmius oreades]|uniref:Uncharacterized protein n=1 Tax=Marasmius oreades TaxID=181124 RepID=A0A9P7RVD6_9AGAR|nr:uncharacterized protein E1B28_011736 [Marasmius oreades]KAG7090127.1 hypothetical protein E1B28_011736 [Marasmius oreades]